MELPKGPVSISLPVLWGDMDAFGHVNNTRYFRWFESARIRYFQALSMPLELSPNGISLILANTSCDYLLPVTYPDQIDVVASTIKLGRSSCVQEYFVYSEKFKGKPVAKGQGVIVLFDFNKQQPEPLPKDLRESIAQLENKEF